jgi:DNA-directed RNA polymerase subunit H
VLEHLYVPKHEVLSKDEFESVVKQYHALPEEFPYILATDPVARAIGAKPGDMVKIFRRSETAGSSSYYRYVVEG